MGQVSLGPMRAKDSVKANLKLCPEIWSEYTVDIVDSNRTLSLLLKMLVSVYGKIYVIDDIFIEI